MEAGIIALDTFVVLASQHDSEGDEAALDEAALKEEIGRGAR